MDLIKALESYIISFLLLFVILMHSFNRKSNSGIINKIFLFLVISDMSGLILEYSAWFFDGRLSWFSYFMVRFTNVLLYIVCPTPLIFWILFVEYQIFSDKVRLKKTIFIILIFYSYTVIMSILTPFTDKFFSINSLNQYVRGPWFFHTQIIYFSFYLYSLYLPLKNRKLVSKKHLFAMLTFLLPSIIGIILQMVFYGLSLIYSSTSISILIVYLSIQNRDLEMDHLTGLYNRLTLDKYIKDKMDSNKQWAGIMIDIDKFKMINDKLGHIVGDSAIIQTSKLIKNCFKADDFIGRFGGDEFIVIVDLKSEEDLEKIVKRLRSKFQEYNINGENQYTLNISIGSAIYKNEMFKTSDQFINHIDLLMYEDKKLNH